MLFSGWIKCEKKRKRAELTAFFVHGFARSGKDEKWEIKIAFSFGLMI